MKTIIYLLFAVLLLPACGETVDSTKEQLSPITQTGANTFGCLFNGGLFLPAMSGAFNTIPDGSLIRLYGYYSQTDSSSLKIDAVRRRTTTNILYIWLYMYKFDSKGVSTYSLGEAIHHETDFQISIITGWIRPIMPILNRRWQICI